MTDAPRLGQGKNIKPPVNGAARHLDITEVFRDTSREHGPPILQRDRIELDRINVARLKRKMRKQRRQNERE